MSPEMMKSPRRQAGLSTGLVERGRCLATAIHLTLGPDKDPAFRVPRDQIREWVRLWHVIPEGEGCGQEGPPVDGTSGPQTAGVGQSSPTNRCTDRPDCQGLPPGAEPGDVGSPSSACVLSQAPPSGEEPAEGGAEVHGPRPPILVTGDGGVRPACLEPLLSPETAQAFGE